MVLRRLSLAAKNNWLAGIPWVSRQLITPAEALNKVLPRSEMLLLVIAETVALLRFFTAPNARPIRCLADIVYKYGRSL